MLTSVSASEERNTNSENSYFDGLRSDFLKILGEILSQKKISPKACHDARVIERRLRIYLSLPEKNKKLKKLSKELKNFHQTLSELRMNDVIFNSFKERVKEANHPLLKVKEDLKQERKKLKQQALKNLNASSLQNILQDPKGLTKKITLKNADALPKKKGQILKKIKQNLGFFLKNQKLKNLHPLRVSLKKWRYLLEIENSFSPLKNDKALTQLKILQDELGLIQDRLHLKEKLIGLSHGPAQTQKAAQEWVREIKLKNKNALLQWKQEGKNVIESVLTLQT